MPKDRKRTKEELLITVGSLRQENARLKTERFSSIVPKILYSLFMWSSFAIIAWQAQIAVTAHAGKETTAEYRVAADGKLTVGANDDTLDVVKNVKWCHWAAFAGVMFGVGGLYYGRAQRTLKRRIINKYHPDARERQLKIDPHRSSSGLTKDGDTHPEDK